MPPVVRRAALLSACIFVRPRLVTAIARFEAPFTALDTCAAWSLRIEARTAIFGSVNPRRKNHRAFTRCGSAADLIVKWIGFRLWQKLEKSWAALSRKVLYP
jgi:hypothetical protein